MPSLAPPALLEEPWESHRADSRSGSVSADVPGVHLSWATEMLPRTALLHSASIVIVAQGFEVGFLGDRKFRYDRIKRAARHRTLTQAWSLPR